MSDELLSWQPAVLAAAMTEMIDRIPEIRRMSKALPEGQQHRDLEIFHAECMIAIAQVANATRRTIGRISPFEIELFEMVLRELRGQE